nr:leucine-rich repeat-containing protein 37A3-like isoform X1 [Peromyscus maniculatus bairdii]
MSLPHVMTPLGFCFCAPSLILTGQVLLVVTQAEPIAEWVHKPVRLTSEPWGPTKLRSWHPSDHRPKSPKAHTSQAGAGDFNYLGSSPPSQMFSPSRKLKDSFLSFQEKDTSAQPHPESDQFTVPHQRLTNKMTPPRKLPGNILKLNGDQNQPPQFKSISSVDQAADNQLYDILVPPLDSKSSGVTKFIVSLQDLKKDLAQHKKLSKVVVGTTNQLVKPQLQNKTVEDDYGDQSMTEANSDSLPVQSQENRKEPPEPSEQAEPPEYQLEAQTQDSENLGVVQEGPNRLPLLPEENEPQKEESVPQFVSEIAALEPPEINGPSLDRNKAQHSNLPNVTVKPEDLEVTVSEADKETQQTLSQQQVPGHLPESPELVESSLTQQEAPVQLSEDLEEVAPSLIQQEAEAPNPELSQELEPSLSQQESLAPIPELSEFLEPSSTQEEALDEILELPEALETSDSQIEVPALPTKPYEEVNPPVEQEAPVPTPESSMESVVGAPAATVPHPSQNQVHHYTLHRTTVKPVDVTVTITSRPFKEVGMSPVQEEIPTQTPGPLVQAEHFPSLEQQPAELSESPEEVDSSESGLEDQIQPPEEAEEEEEEPSPIQQEVQSEHPGPLLEDESFPIELEQPAQPSEFLEEEGLGSGNHPEAFIAPAELPEEAKPPIKLPAPLQAPESTVGNVDEIPPVHQVTVQPTQSEEHHYQLPNVTVRPVDVTLTITSEPTKEMESSLTQQESPVHPLENAEETEPFLSEQPQPAQASELEIPTQSSEHALIQQEQATQSSEHHEVTVSPLTHHSSLSTTTVNPPDVLLTITQEPTAEVVPPPVHHETIAKPFTVPEKDVDTSTAQYTNPAITPEASDGVELLSNQHEASVQSLEPVQYEKPSLSQQEDTDEESELQEETEPSSAQQETSVQPLDLPHETVVQPLAHHEATGSNLVHSQVHPLASYNATAKPPELINEVETSSQQGFEPSKEQQEEVTTQHPPTPENQHSPGVPTQPEELLGEVSSGQQGNLSPPLKHPLDTEFLPYQQELPDQSLEPPKEGFFLSPVGDTLFFSPEDLEAIFRYEHSMLRKTTVKHPNQAHTRAPESSMGVKSLQVQEEDLVQPIVPTEQVEFSQVQFDSPSHTPGFPETEFSPQEAIAQKTDLHKEVYPFPTQREGPYLPPDSTMGSELSPAQHMTRSQLADLSENVEPSPVLQPTLTQAPEPPKEIDRSPTQQAVPHQLPDSMNNIVTHLPTHQMIVPTPGQIQAEYPTSSSISFHPLDLELHPITSPHTTEADHTTVQKSTTPQVTFPHQTQHLNPTEVTVQPLDLGLTITPQPTPEELSQTIPESTTHLTEPLVSPVPIYQEVTVPTPGPPTEVLAPAPIYQEVAIPTLGQDQADTTTHVVSFHSLDLGLTTTSETTREPQPPIIPQETIVLPPKPPQIQPLDIELAITHQPTPEELSQTTPESTSHLTEPLTEVLAPAPIYQEATFPTPGHEQAVTFHPLEQEVTITSETTREIYHSTTRKETIVLPPKPQMTLPQHVPIQHLNPSEVTVQPMDLELTVTTQPTPEKELPQIVPETTIVPAQVTEPLREVVPPAPLYQEVTVPTPGQAQAEYTTGTVVSFHPLDLELTMTSEPTRETQPHTISRETIVLPPKPPQMTLPQQVPIQHLNPSEVTVQPLDLELTTTTQSTPEKELPQIVPETTIVPAQVTEPPREVVPPTPLYQEVTVPTPGQAQAEYTTAHVVSFHPLDLGLTTTSETTKEPQPPTIPQEIIVLPPNPPQMTLPQQVPIQHLNPSEVTVQPMDLELTITHQPTPEELSQTTPESTTHLTEPLTEVLAPVPLYQEVAVPTLGQDQADTTTHVVSFHPLDLGLTTTSEPTREPQPPATPQETAFSPPQYHQLTLPEEVHIQHPNLTEVTIQPLDLELTVTPSSHLDVEPSPSTQEILPEPEQPHEVVAAQAPVFYEIPIQDQTQHPLVSEVTVQQIELEHNLITISKLETELFAAPYNITALPLTHQEVTFQPEDQVHAQHVNPTQVTIHPSHPEFSITPRPATMVKRSAPVQPTESPKATVTQSSAHFDATVLATVHDQSQHPNLETLHSEISAITQPESSHFTIPAITHPETTHSIVLTTTHLETTQSAVPKATSPPPTQHEGTLPPPNQVQTLQSNSTEVTTQSSQTEFSTALQSVSLVSPSPPMSHITAQSTVLTSVQDQGQHPTTAPPPTYPIVTFPSTEQVQTQQIPSEATLQPMDMEFPLTPYATTFSTERELLVQMKPNSSMTTNICDFCLCENETLLCSHLSPKRRLHQVPVPRPEIHKHPLTFLNFQGNSISYIEKHVWKAYRWTETLILSENLLTELHKDTFEGLLSLQVLDVSCNKIRYIERRTFESLPFVKYMNLGCNLLIELSFGTFQAWHGMQFLQKLILSRNPLTVVEDPYFYKLPALKYLDLGTTQVPLKALENILMMTLELEHLILPKHMVCCLCKYKADIEIVCKTIKLHCHIGCLINTTYCLEASIGNPEGPFMKVLQSRKENTSTELAIEPESSALEKDALSSSGFMNEQLDFNDESDVISALNYILPYFSEGNLEDVVSTLLPFIKLLFSNIQSTDNSLEPYKNDSRSLALNPVPKASKMAYKNKLNKLYFLENLLDAEIDEVRKKEKTAMLMQQSSRLGSKFKRRIFEKRWEPAQAEESSLAEIEKAEKRLHRMNRVLQGTGSIQKRHFKDVSAKSLWSKQSDHAPVENIAKDGQLRSPPTTELQQLHPGQKLRKSGGNSFHSEPLLPKEHREAVSFPPEQSLVDEAATTKSLPEFIDRRKDLSYTIYVLESANANVKRTKGSNPNLQSEERHRNLRKKKSHFQLIAKKPASSAVRSLVNSPAGRVFSSLGDLSYAGKPFSELYAASEPSTEKPPEENHTTTVNTVNTGGNSLKTNTTTVPEGAASETTTPENPATESNVTTSDSITTVKQTSEPPLDFILGAHSHVHFKENEYPLVMSPGDQFESHLNKQLRPLIPNNNVRRLISHVIRTLKMDCTDSHVQLSCAKLISRTGLLMKLLSEQQEFKLSRTDWDTEQWKTENYINESTEAQGEQKGLEPSQLTKAVPGYGYNNKVILAISVTVVVTVLIIIFCLIEVRTTGHSCVQNVLCVCNRFRTCELKT